VPFDSLKRDARERKAIIEGIQQASAKLAKLAGSECVSHEKAKAEMNELRQELVKLKGEVRSWRLLHHFMSTFPAPSARLCSVALTNLDGETEMSSLVDWA
jgi:hypothetical protein